MKDKLKKIEIKIDKFLNDEKKKQMDSGHVAGDCPCVKIFWKSRKENELHWIHSDNDRVAAIWQRILDFCCDEAPEMAFYRATMKQRFAKFAKEKGISDPGEANEIDLKFEMERYVSELNEQRKMKKKIEQKKAQNEEKKDFKKIDGRWVSADRKLKKLKNTKKS